MTTLVCFIVAAYGFNQLVRYAKNNPGQMMDLGMFIKKVMNKR